MTLSEIRDEVGALGFESEVRATDSFIFALNRALGEIYSAKPIHSELTFFKSAPKNRIKIGKIFHTGGTERKVNIPVGAYTFFLSGRGSYSLSDSSGTRTFDFNTERERCVGVVEEASELCFYGDRFFSVYDLTLYPGYLVDDTELIPTGRGYTEYEIKKYASDYLALADEARDEEGNPISGAEICCGKIRVPSQYSGEINLTYRKSAPRITLDMMDSEVDIPREIEHLVPLLTAAYVWLDDDEEKASYYMAIYRENLASLKLYSTSCKNNSYVDLTGWA